MPFSENWTPTASTQYQELRDKAHQSFLNRQKKKKNAASPVEGLFRQVEKTIFLLLTNPKHPSLKTHAYDSIPHPWSPKEKIFEAYAQNNTSGAYRVFWCYGPGQKQITIIAITPHP